MKRDPEKLIAWRRKSAKKARANQRKRRISRQREEIEADPIHFGPPGFVEWVHSLACSVPGCRGVRVEAAHAVSRGAGGTWKDILPLCWFHHRVQHTVGVKTFEWNTGIVMSDIAAVVYQRWIAFAGREELDG